MNTRVASEEISPRKAANTSVGIVLVRFPATRLTTKRNTLRTQRKEQEMDNLTTAMLDRMEEGEIADLSPDVLNTLHWLVADELVKARQRENKLNLAFERRYAAKAGEALLADGRDTGTVHLTDGRFDVAVTRPKRVKWNEAALREALDTLDPETARHLRSSILISIFAK